MAFCHVGLGAARSKWNYMDSLEYGAKIFKEYQLFYAMRCLDSNVGTAEGLTIFPLNTAYLDLWSEIFPLIGQGRSYRLIFFFNQ